MPPSLLGGGFGVWYNGGRQKAYTTTLRNKMATTVYETIDIELLDGTKIAMRPLKISLLRDFMKKFAEIAEVADDNDKSMDILLECVQIAMKQYAPDLAVDRERLEDSIDLPSVYKVVEAASGIKFDDTGNLTAGLPGTN